MADQLLAGIPPVFTSNGEVVAGGSVTFYETGTLSPVSIWADQSGTFPLPNPVALDADGRPPQLFYTGSVAVKIVIKDADGVEVDVIDPSPRFSVTASGADGVTFSPVPSNPSTDVQTAIETISDALASFSDSPIATPGGGTANAISLTTGKSLTAVPTGQKVDFIPTLTNTGAMTVAIDGLPPVAILTITGEATPAGYVRAGIRTSMYYDGTQWIASRQVEVFSNANGNSYAYEDGTMLAYHTRSDTFSFSASGSGFIDLGRADWTFPVTRAFIASPHADYQTNTGGITGATHSVSVTKASVVAKSFTSLPGAVNVRLRATGRWY